MPSLFCGIKKVKNIHKGSAEIIRQSLCCLYRILYFNIILKIIIRFRNNLEEKYVAYN